MSSMTMNVFSIITTIVAFAAYASAEKHSISKLKTEECTVTLMEEDILIITCKVWLSCQEDDTNLQIIFCPKGPSGKLPLKGETNPQLGPDPHPGPSIEDNDGPWQ
ncbi:hypothetical protein BDQ17DRAFT_1329071 [Cyathus striatus]|nr:hypothetical protein BDQ17DRAFT_1329071 [Cyathus striatus]